MRVLKIYEIIYFEDEPTFVFALYARQSSLLGACADATSLLVRRVNSMRVFTFAQWPPFPHIETCNVIIYNFLKSYFSKF